MNKETILSINTHPRAYPCWVNVYQQPCGKSYGLLHSLRHYAAAADATTSNHPCVYRIRVAWKPGRAPNGEA